MINFRCCNCKNLQFKYQLKGNCVEIEVKCYSCNTMNKFTVWLPQIIKENEKNNEHKQE